ncbi:MAG: alpha/beta fold hydrolase [Acidobacteriota bacterium]
MIRHLRQEHAVSRLRASPPGGSYSVYGRLLSACLLVCLVLCTVACGDKPRTDFYGAYKLDNGEVLVIVPSAEKNTLRLYNTANGLSRRLYPVAGANLDAATVRYQTGDGWSVKEPAVLFVELHRAAAIAPTISFEEAGKAPVKGRRMPIESETVEFESEGIRLTGCLYLPQEPGPHPAIVLHQGSEHDSWKDYNGSGYLFAANGIAAFCYDKRGVGSSQGKFTMDFYKLAADMCAAVECLKQHKAIDPDRIGVGGYSQGGWIGPLAASQRSDIRFVHVGFGLADSPFDEDREETLNALRDLGYKDADLARARRVIGATQEVIRQGLKGGWDELEAVKKECRNEPWMKHMDGGITEAFIKWPGWCLRIFARNRILLYGLSWDYDPRPVLEKVQVPMLWLLGGEDREAPNRETLARLDVLKKKGKPLDVVVFPATDHGGVVFREDKGERIITGFHPDYMRTEVDWVSRAVGVNAGA